MFANAFNSSISHVSKNKGRTNLNFELWLQEQDFHSN